MLVFGMGEDMIAFIKLSQIEKIASRLSEKLKMINDIIKKRNNTILLSMDSIEV